MNNFLLPIHRDWRKPWNWSSRTWGIAIVVTALLSPVAVRWFLLWRVPNVTLPFSIEEVIPDEVPTDEDATPRYRKAIELLAKTGLVLEEDPSGFANDLEADTAIRNAVFKNLPWDPRLDVWLLGRRKSLDEFRVASEMKRASGPNLSVIDINEIADTFQQIRRLVVMTSAEALRLERANDFDAAWEWHCSNLRCARHCMMPRYSICALIGVSIRSVAYVGIVRWSEHPNLTVEQLQIAREEIRIDRDHPIEVLDLLKSNYLSIRNSMDRKDLSDYVNSWLDSTWPKSSAVRLGKRMILWMNGEPEILLRTARQELVNVADQLELPITQRRACRRLKFEMVFELDSQLSRFPGQVAADRLHELINGNQILSKSLDNCLLCSGSLDITNRRDLSRKILLEIVLACQQYRHNYGALPETLENLIPEYLDSLPIDPMDLTGGPIKLRREEDGSLIVWSNGNNESDDGGQIDTDREESDIGYRLRVAGSTGDAAQTSHDRK